MRCRLLALVVVAFCAFTCPAAAQETVRNHTVNIDDYFTLARISAVALSPDGKQVAYSEARWQESTGDRKSDLWVVETQTAKHRKLTFDRCNPHGLAWSGDSKAIYFLGNRKVEGDKTAPSDSKTQIWRVNPVGDFKPITQIDRNVEMFALTSDGRYVFYVTEADHLDSEWKALREKHKSVDYANGATTLSQVWKLDTESWRPEKVLDAKRHIYEIALTPDGKKLALITAPDDRVVSFEGKSRVEVWDGGTNTSKPIPDECYRQNGRSPYAWIENLAIAPDGKTVAFNAIWDGFPCEIVLGSWKDSKWTSRLMRRAPGTSVRGYGGPMAFTGNKELAFLSEAKARVHLARNLNVDDPEARETARGPVGDHVVGLFSHDASGQAKAVVMGTPTELPEIYIWEAGKKPRRLTNINPQTASWKLPKLSVVSWTGANGDAVEGILELPPDYQPGQKIPLAIDIHGGPTMAYLFERAYDWYSGRTILPARGFAVLCPNYRGSSGYGDKFLIDLIGKENDWEVQDILKGVDHLVGKQIADPQRLAVMGWSNGGYLTNCCLTHTDRFKAAISGAGIIDALMEFAINDEPAYSIVFKRGFPWTPDNNYVKASPSWHLDKVRTPTLIHVGGNDERCPPGNSRMLYRVLKDYNNVPTELLVYPGEPHGLRKYASVRAKLEWDQAWLSRYVLEKTK